MMYFCGATLWVCLGYLIGAFMTGKKLNDLEAENAALKCQILEISDRLVCDEPPEPISWMIINPN